MGKVFEIIKWLDKAFLALAEEIVVSIMSLIFKIKAPTKS
jgi:hypothetical protein